MVNVYNSLLLLSLLSYSVSSDRIRISSITDRQRQQQKRRKIQQTTTTRITETAQDGLIQQSRSNDDGSSKRNWLLKPTNINKKHTPQTLSELQEQSCVKRRKKSIATTTVRTTNDNESVDTTTDSSPNNNNYIIGGSTHIADRQQHHNHETMVDHVLDERRTQSFYKLSTPLNGQNGNYGVMFDVTSPATGSHSVTIKSFEINANVINPQCPVKVYTRKGPHKGFETSSSAWKLLVDTDEINCLGFGQHTIIPNSKFLLDDSDISLVGGETLSFYIYLSTPDLRYGNGNSFGAIMTSNSYLQLREGSGLAGFFKTVFAPRAFNGVVNFVVDATGGGLDSDNGGNAAVDNTDTCDSVLATTYIDNLGSYGNMYDIESKSHEIEIYQIDIYTDVEAPITYEIYTRKGSYVDGSSLESWTLLERGTTNGLGNGMGTPIRNFAPFVVPQQSRQGFYITLTTPDMRYRNITTDIPDAKIGDIYFENEDLEIEVGVSVGTWPLGTAFFGPRVWSGAIHYTVDRGCPTFAPSLAPEEAVVDTWAPTIMPTSEPTAGMNEPQFGNCTETTPVTTTLEGGTGAFGNMFTIQTHNDPISILTLELHAENQGDMLHVFVYTKLGDYKGYEDDKSAWRLICETFVPSAGAGYGTLLPESDFETIHMVPNQQRALYVTIETPDIRYSRSEEAIAIGQPVVEMPYISINAGAGLTQHPFGTSLFEPRLFNGRLIVKHTVDCYAYISTAVTYSFVIQTRSDVTTDEVIPLVSVSVHQSIHDILTNPSSSLNQYVTDYNLQLDNVTSVISDATPPDDAGSCTFAFPCTVVNAIVTVTHLDTISSGEVTQAMTPYRDYINDNLKDEEFQSDIFGRQLVTTSVTITLNGDFTATMNEGESSYFTEVSAGFFNNQFEGDESGLSVNGIDVTGQEIYYNDRRRSLAHRLLSRFLQRGADDSDGNGGYIDIAATVTGEYSPPPDINFDTKVSAAIGENEDEYVEDLKTGGDVQLTDDGIVRSMPFFEKVEGVDVRLQNVAPTPPPTMTLNDDDGLNLYVIVGAVIGGIVLCVGLIWLCTRRGSPDATPVIGLVGLGPSPLEKRGLFGGRSNNDLFNDKVMDAQVTYANIGGGNLDVGYGVQTTQYPGEVYDDLAPPAIAPPPIKGPSNRSLNSGGSSGMTSISSGGEYDNMPPHLRQQSNRRNMGDDRSVYSNGRSVASRSFNGGRSVASMNSRSINGGRSVTSMNSRSFPADERTVGSMRSMNSRGTMNSSRGHSVGGRQVSSNRMTSLADVPIYER